MKKITLILSIIMAFLFFSCGASKNIVLTSKQAQDSVVLSPRDSLSIELVSNASTGYHWTYKTDKKLKFIESHYISPKTNLIGAAGKQVFIFKAKKKGSLILKFFYSRPNADTIKQKEINVTIK